MKGLNGPRTFVVRMPDDSMAPRFEDGDHVQVDPDGTAEPGRFVAVRQDGSAATVRLLVEEDGRRVLRALSGADPDRVLDADGGNDILGVAVFRGRAV